MPADFSPVRHFELAAATTLGVGGPASFFARCPDREGIGRALAWAGGEGLPVFVLGGGSNLLVADAGFAGLVVAPNAGNLALDLTGPRPRLRAEAGCDWDAVVAAAVEAGCAGLEALSGIPGTAGAAPIQNIGAYGQEIAASLRTVEVWDRHEGRARLLEAGECGLAYRDSHFKGPWRDRFVVLAIELELESSETAPVLYAELRRRLDAGEGERRPLTAIRAAVLALRAEKAMLYRPEEPDGRSAGSFFVNPVVSKDDADGVELEARRRGGQRAMPRYDAPHGVKLSAAWLIEEAGFRRGWGEGKAGLSTRHTLAIVNRGGARAEDILAVARAVRRGVAAAFGVELQPEPFFLGFDRTSAELLR